MLLADLPFIPLIALTIVISLVFWQIYSYWVYRKRNQKPNVPEINQKTVPKTGRDTIKNATLLKAIKPKTKIARKTSILFSSAIGVFVLVNLLILTFYLRNRKLTYLPRADEIITPTISAISVTPITPTLTIQPTLPHTTSTPYPTRQTTVLPTFLTTPIPTATKIPPSPTVKPTTVLTAIPTAKPTLLAQYGANVVKPTTKPVVTTIVPSIPQTGIGTSSLLLAGLSLIFLMIGLAL